MSNYKFKDTSFAKHIKKDWREELEIEIGDSKQSSLFYPQLKVKRWGNEVNLSIRLKDDDYTQGSYSLSDDDKIIWKKGKKSVRFYDIPISLDNLFGGHEIDVLLEEKPFSNIIEFTLESKGCTFYYQRELTQKFLLKTYWKNQLLQ